MSILDQLRWSLRHSRRQFLESTLVVLAIALGVGVIVTVLTMFVSLGEQYQTFTRLEEFRTLEILDRGEHAMREGAALTLIGSDLVSTRWTATLDEVEQLQQNLPPGLNAFVQLGWSARTPLLPENVEEDSRHPWFGANHLYIFGTLPAYFNFLGTPLAGGSFFLPEDVHRGSRVMVLSWGLAQELFGEEDVVGRVVPLQTFGGEEVLDFTVIGVLSPGERDEQPRNPLQARTAYVPLTASPYSRESRQSRFPSVSIGLEPGQDLAAALERVRGEAELLWGDQVVVSSPLAQFQESRRQMERYALLIGALASVGLVIAVINILNLMLARVLKRTKSIGISMALGSSRVLVFRQFLVEAFSLGLLGSLLGIAFSFGLGRLLSRVLGAAFPGMVGTRIFLGVLLGFGVSLLFGVYPAYLGARTNPVDALRTD